MTNAAQIEAILQNAAQQPPDRALKLLEQILNENPKTVAAWLMAGDILQSVGEFNQAIDAYRRVIYIAPDHSTARYRLAQLMIHHGLLADAELLVDQMLQAQPQSPDAWTLLASLRQKQIRDSDAAVALRHSLSLAANSAAHSNLLQVMQ